MKKFKKLMIAGLATVMAVGVASSFAACGGKTELIVNTQFGAGDGHNGTFTQLNKDFIKNNKVKITDKSGNPSADKSWDKYFQADMLSENNQPDVVYYQTGAMTADFVNTIEVDGKKTTQSRFVSVEEIRKEYPDFAKNIVLDDSDPNSIPIKGTTQGIMYDKKKVAADTFSTYEKMIGFFNEEQSDSFTTENKGLNCRRDVPHYWFNALMCKYLGIKEFEALDGTKAFFDAGLYVESDKGETETDEQYEARIIEEKAAYDAKKKIADGHRTAWEGAFVSTVKDMRKIGFSQKKTAAPAGNEANFFEGKNSALLDGSWQAGNYSKLGTDIAFSASTEMAITALPGGDKDGTGFVAGGITTGWFITRKAWEDPKKRDLAVKYVEAHTSDAAVNEYCAKAGGYPTTGKAVTGASAGTVAFASLTDGNKVIVPVDDRVSASAKSTLLTNWTEAHPFAIMLKSGTSDNTVSDVHSLFGNFIVALA